MKLRPWAFVGLFAAELALALLFSMTEMQTVALTHVSMAVVVLGLYATE